MELHSINYMHFGEPKQWYGIPPAQADRMDTFLISRFPLLYQSCPEFIRHKECIVSPAKLRAAGITTIQTRQYPGQFIITWPKAYHQGFNYGLNCAEAYVDS